MPVENLSEPINLIWKSFVFSGSQFLAVFDTDQTVHVLGDTGLNFGSYMSIESFKKYYANHGGGLALGEAKLCVLVRVA